MIRLRLSCRLRIQQIEELRRRTRGAAATASSSGSAPDDTASGPGANYVGEQPAPKQRRVMDVLAADSASDDDSGEDELGLDWRAKGLQ